MHADRATDHAAAVLHQEHGPKLFERSIWCLQISKRAFLLAMQQAEMGTMQTVTSELTHLLFSVTCLAAGQKTILIHSADKSGHKQQANDMQ